MRRVMGSVITAVAVTVGVMVSLAPSSSAATSDPLPPGGRYVPITPVRAVDTRHDGAGIGPGKTLVVNLRRMVPSATATAVVVTLTATQPTASGYLTAFPHGVGRPVASSLNKRAGETRSNTVTVALPTDGSRRIDVFNQAGRTQLVVDVSGYYDPAAQTGDFFPSYTPLRLIDTRGNGREGDGTGVEVTVPRNGSESASAVAVVITAVGPTHPGYVTAWDGSGAEPVVSTVNYGSDPATANSAVVSVVPTDDGQLRFSIRNHIGSAYLIVDLMGWYSAANGNGGLYYPVTPNRILDTRTGGTGPLHGDTTRDLAVPDLGGPTRRLVAVALNVTAVNATSPTYLRFWGSTQDNPLASSLNPSSSAPVANSVQPGVYRINGDDLDTPYIFHAYNNRGDVDVVVDLQGEFIND